jgi:hypothetical protein
VERAAIIGKDLTEEASAVIVGTPVIGPVACDLGAGVMRTKPSRSKGQNRKGDGRLLPIGQKNAV